MHVLQLNVQPSSLQRILGIAEGSHGAKEVQPGPRIRCQAHLCECAGYKAYK